MHGQCQGVGGREDTTTLLALASRALGDGPVDGEPSKRAFPVPRSRDACVICARHVHNKRAPALTFSRVHVQIDGGPGLSGVKVRGVGSLRSVPRQPLTATPTTSGSLPAVDLIEGWMFSELPWMG